MTAERALKKKPQPRAACYEFKNLVPRCSRCDDSIADASQLKSATGPVISSNWVRSTESGGLTWQPAFEANQMPAFPAFRKSHALFDVHQMACPVLIMMNPVHPGSRDSPSWLMIDSPVPGEIRSGFAILDDTVHLDCGSLDVYVNPVSSYRLIWSLRWSNP